MPNGKPGDNPVTDTIVHGLHPFGKDIEELVIELYTRNPGVFDDLQQAPFDWEKGRFVPEAIRLLQGLLDHSDDPLICRRLLEEYWTDTKTKP